MVGSGKKKKKKKKRQNLPSLIIHPNKGKETIKTKIRKYNTMLGKNCHGENKVEYGWQGMPEHQRRGPYGKNITLDSWTQSQGWIWERFTMSTSNVLDTSWVSYNSTQFWHSLPRGNVRFHSLRIQSCNNTHPPLQTLVTTRVVTRASDQLATNWRFPNVISWTSDASPKSRPWSLLLTRPAINQRAHNPLLDFN